MKSVRMVRKERERENVKTDELSKIERRTAVTPSPSEVSMQVNGPKSR